MVVTLFLKGLASVIILYTQYLTLPNIADCTKIASLFPASPVPGPAHSTRKGCVYYQFKGQICVKKLCVLFPQ